MLGAIPEATEPLPLVLEDTLARQAVGTHDSVQAGLSGDRLPPSIVQFDAAIGDGGDVVTMEVDPGGLHPCRVAGDDLGVLQFPVTPLGDSGVHEAFDLTHEAVSFELMSL